MGALIAAIVQAVLAVLGFARERQAGQARAEDRTAGGNAVAATTNAETVHEIETAAAAREAVRADLAARPDSLRDDDGFRRPD